MPKHDQLEILRSMLDSLKSGNPDLKQMIGQMSQHRLETKRDAAISSEVIRRLRIQNKKLQHQILVLKDRLKEKTARTNNLATQISELIRLRNILSAALGSCSSCWGENQQCPDCSGNGSAGWRPVNKRLFNIHVLPIVVKLYGLKK
ncbi:MAG: hypothetical protein EOO09_03235 [Chitinophagaceae bacterium]|nr:MAG: hypothetical protein EOO09_03235 [Chitinophagaceae bacterium]